MFLFLVLVLHSRMLVSFVQQPIFIATRSLGHRAGRHHGRGDFLRCTSGRWEKDMDEKGVIRHRGGRWNCSWNSRFYSNRAAFHWMMKQIFTTMVEMFVYIRNSLDPWKSKSTVHKNLDFSPLVDDFRGAGNLGWLSDLLERLSDLQLGHEKGTLNHLW